MIKSYTFVTETKATKENYSKKDFINNHKVNVKIFKMLLDKVSNNNQYERLYTTNNYFSTPYYSSRKIIVHYIFEDLERNK